MTAPKIYGIKNCDTMKKAFKWMDANGVAYDFHDYKKQDIDKDILIAAIKVHGWENVINRRGTTWRKLPDDIKESMDEKKAVEQAAANPSMIKRPLLIQGDNILLGFDDIKYPNLCSYLCLNNFSINFNDCIFINIYSWRFNYFTV